MSSCAAPVTPGVIAGVRPDLERGLQVDLRIIAHMSHLMFLCARRMHAHTHTHTPTQANLQQRVTTELPNTGSFKGSTFQFQMNKSPTLECASLPNPSALCCKTTAPKAGHRLVLECRASTHTMTEYSYTRRSHRSTHACALGGDAPRKSVAFDAPSCAQEGHEE